MKKLATLVEHAFHNDPGQRYVEAQATQAWLDTLAWFAKHLKQTWAMR